MTMASDYARGRRDDVWRQLRALGDRAQAPEHIEDARAVTDLMAARARDNVEELVRRLDEHGYRFVDNGPAARPMAPLIPADANSNAFAEWLTAEVGPVPLTVTSWIRMVGDVWLVGSHPEWGARGSGDPLVLQWQGLHYPEVSMRDHVRSDYVEWVDEYGADLPFALEFSPDRLTKADVSGGDPYSVVLPDACADGLVEIERLPMPFVGYLNAVFAEGGFFSTVDGPPWEIRQQLAKDLLPL